MRKILIVEDNPNNMRFVVTVLESAGHSVVQAVEADSGIRLARETLPDLIFMDIQLPGMDGLDATRQLKADPTTSPIPVYALTAFSMAGDEERIRAAGCDGYLAKPVSYKDLLAAVARATTVAKEAPYTLTPGEKNGHEHS